MENIFKGLITAIITPFRNGQLDFASLSKILDYQVEHGVEAVVVGGSTGEGSSLRKEEYLSLIQTARQLASNKLKIIAGLSISSTAIAIEMVEALAGLQPDGLMCCIPPYVKPTQEGIFQHFKAIHDISNMPVMLYTVPSRTGVDFTDDTILKLSALPRLLALKDAGGDIERPLRLGSQVKEGFNFLAGDDSAALAYNINGGRGCVSVASNITPSLSKKIQDDCLKGNWQEALKTQRQLLPLYTGLFIESNPIPVKYAASYLGLCNKEIRLPLLTASDKTRKYLAEVIDHIMRND